MAMTGQDAGLIKCRTAQFHLHEEDLKAFKGWAASKTWDDGIQDRYLVCGERLPFHILNAKGEAELWGQQPQSEEVLPVSGQAQLAEPEHRGPGKSASRTHTPSQDPVRAKPDESGANEPRISSPKGSFEDEESKMDTRTIDWAGPVEYEIVENASKDQDKTDESVAKQSSNSLQETEKDPTGPMVILDDKTTNVLLEKWNLIATRVLSLVF